MFFFRGVIFDKLDQKSKIVNRGKILERLMSRDLSKCYCQGQVDECCHSFR